MIAGLVIDTVDIERIVASISREAGFREMIFSKKEIAYCEAKANKFECYAARFAAKEAFFKALGTGWLEGTQFNEVEITNNEIGKPELGFLGETKKTISSWGIDKILVSLSHTKISASAVVIIEKQV